MIHWLRFTLWCLVLLLAAPVPVSAEPSPDALSQFNFYIRTIESRLAQQHRAQNTFLAPFVSAPQTEARLRRGELIVDKLTPSTSPVSEGALLHHWRGTAFVPGATAGDFLRVTQDFNNYPKYFAPQILRARVLAQEGNRLQASMRVRQHHIITLVFDISSDIDYGRLDPQHEYSFARSTRISEIDAPGTAKERALSPSEDHGYLLLEPGYQLVDLELRSTDPLDFTDLKPYKSPPRRSPEEDRPQRRHRQRHRPHRPPPVVLSAMEYAFIGGSMGAVVGEPSPAPSTAPSTTAPRSSSSPPPAARA
jgi:hypothetical protein